MSEIKKVCKGGVHPSYKCMPHLANRRGTVFKRWLLLISKDLTEVEKLYVTERKIQFHPKVIVVSNSETCNLKRWIVLNFLMRILWYYDRVDQLILFVCWPQKENRSPFWDLCHYQHWFKCNLWKSWRNCLNVW